MLPAVRADVASRGLERSVSVLGFRKDVSAILGLTDVFIHPSRQDPCPLAVLEASAAGRPVIAYADGGIPEIVAHGATGLLVPTGDRDALASSLHRLLSDRELARRMGAAGRERMAGEFRPDLAGARLADALLRVRPRAPRGAGRSSRRA
jgi:glycosyltransferase involved in cell wall biosynthesis